MPAKSFLSLLKTTFKEFQDDNALQLGAALSYYAALSLAPLLVIALSLAGLFYSGEDVRVDVVRQLDATIGSEASAAVEVVLENADRPELGTFTAVAGGVMLLVGASGVFAQLQKSLNQIWNVQPRSDAGIQRMIKVRLRAMALVLAIGFLLIVLLGISTAISALAGRFEAYVPIGGSFAGVLNVGVSFVALTFLFGLIFRGLPDVRISWKDVGVGAVITAGLFTIGQLLIGYYLGYTSTASPYGAAGSLIVLLIWVYYSAQIFFFGAEFTQVWSRRYGQAIVPADYAEWSDCDRQASAAGHAGASG